VWLGYFRIKLLSWFNFLLLRYGFIQPKIIKREKRTQIAANTLKVKIVVPVISVFIPRIELLTRIIRSVNGL